MSTTAATRPTAFSPRFIGRVFARALEGQSYLDSICRHLVRQKDFQPSLDGAQMLRTWLSNPAHLAAHRQYVKSLLRRTGKLDDETPEFEVTKAVNDFNDGWINAAAAEVVRRTVGSINKRPA